MMEMTAAPSYHINTTDESGEDDTYYDEYADLSRSLKIMSATVTVIYCLTFVLGVLGNGVVIWVTGFKMKKTVNTVWFLNLAVADFLFTALLSFRLAYIALDFHWPFGKFMCKLHHAAKFMNMFTSVYFLMVISVDRYVSVVWPVWAQNHRNVRKASYVSLGVWVLGLFLSTPTFIFRDTLSFDDGHTFCYNNFAFPYDNDTQSVVQLRLLRFKAMTITHILLGFVVPSTVIVYCYVVIIHRFRRNRTLANHSSRPFKIMAAIIITFFLCWAPFYIINLIELAHHIDPLSNPVSTHVIIIGVPLASCLICVNSCLNPLLYAFMCQDYKDQVRKSILKVFEAAFQEEVPPSHTDTQSVETRLTLNKSVHDTEV